MIWFQAILAALMVECLASSGNTGENFILITDLYIFFFT